MRKRRTRQHIVGDLGVNHVERQVLLAGFTLERTRDDYGIDATIRTFDEIGQIEDTRINLQIKATESAQIIPQRRAYAFDLSKRDLEFWLLTWRATFLVLYDVRVEHAFYLELQAYFRENALLLRSIKKFVRVYIPQDCIFEPSSIHQIRKNANHALPH